MKSSIANNSVPHSLSIDILYNKPTKRFASAPSAIAAEEDTEESAREVASALTEKGAVTTLVPITETTIASAVASLHGDLVFNLIEWTGVDMPHAMATYDEMDARQLRYTGATKENYRITCDKVLMKQRMDESHLPTPPWQLFETGNETVKTGFLFPAIIKVAREHSSVGLTKDAVVSSPETLRATVRSRLKEYSQPVYAESFVTGREFQVTMLSQRTGPLILPPAEIVYTKDTDVPFLTYESRWNEEHPDYDNSQVGLAKLDNDLLTRIETMSMDAYTAFGFRDYARFDIRCDGDTPYFLEVNSNPGLGDDNEYGMTVSYKSLGMTFADFVWEIVASAIRRYDSEGM